MQIRIYYESLEQGANYIKPLVDKAVDKCGEVVLVRRPKKSSETSGGSVAAIMTMITPDVLITGVCYGKEYPLPAP